MNRHSRTLRVFACSAALLYLTRLSLAQAADAIQAQPTHEELVKMHLKASAQEMEWWHDAKFGIFIHWGVGMTRGAPWMNKTDETYFQGLFENLKKVTQFNAEEWIDVVKAGGGKYVIFVTKQNGYMQRRPDCNFCLWDTKTTDNKITHPNSPFRRDVCKEIADAAHKAGIKLEWYHSGPAGERLIELLTRYGKVSGVWFDGGYVPGGTPEQVYQMMRKLQPGIVTNGGLGGKYGGDYDTPQHDMPWPGWHGSRPIEVAAILRNGYWYWDKPNRSVKSFKEVINLLMRCVGNGNNLALNLAPAPDGHMEPNEINRIKEVGAWLGKYGASVYATRKGPFILSEWGVSTRSKKGNTVYLHVLRDLRDGKMSLPPLTRKIVSARLLTSPDGRVDVAQDHRGITVTIPPGLIDPVDTIVALELDGPAMEAQVARVPSGSLAEGKPVQATQTFTWPGAGATLETNGPHNAVDGNFETGWCSTADKADAAKPRWLAVDLGKAHNVSRALVSLYLGLGEHPNGPQEFEIQVRRGDGWVSVFDSRSLRGVERRGWDHRVEFKPVSGSELRLGIWGKNTYVREFQLFE